MRPVSDVPTSQEIIDRDKFLTEFRTDAYLRDFYTKVEDPAMQMVLNCLPNIVTRLGNVKRVLDFGAGPTIHVAASFRNQATEIYLADYLPQNRKELSLWCEGRSDFDWSEPLKMILSQEGNSWSDLDQMIALTRKKICGVYHCDCFSRPSVDMPAEMQGTFEVVVTIFCVEYCCKTYEEYKNAIKNIVDQIRPGGFLIMGGILAETWCAFGGRVFSCLYVTKEMMLNALSEAGVHLEEGPKCIMFEVNDMFLISARKHRSDSDEN